MFTHLDLFSGIGGFALAAMNVWGDKYKNVGFCEIDKFCQKVLKKNFGSNIKIFDNIIDITGEEFGTIDLITGGFPCQPFSQAGRRKGREDERALFPEMVRVIRKTKPKWVLAENVSGILNIHNGEYFEEICTQLEGEGYTVQSFIIPATAVNAPHKRERVWIIAYTERNGLEELPEQWGEIKRILQKASNTFTTHSTIKRINRCGNRDINRGDYGLSSGLDRNNRLRALGNAIVPQVAEAIMQVIKETT